MEHEIEKISASIKDKLVAVCQQVLAFAESEDFPQGTKDIEFSLDRLRNEEFEVVVCGEVKKGKSSFINAIIGEDILPVDTKVATSQAFRIVNGL